MGRAAKPWYWAARRAWFINFQGRKVKLVEGKNDGPTKKLAKEEFCRLQLNSGPKIKNLSVGDIIGQFLEYQQNNKAKRTYEFYVEKIQSFLDFDRQPNRPAEELRPEHVEAWMNSHKTWASGNKRGHAGAVKTAFNWAVKTRRLPVNPLLGLEKPPEGKRELFLTPEEYERLLSLVKSDQFRDVLQFLWFTGCRPQELTRMEARHVNTGFVLFPKEEAKGKRRPRIIYLVTEAQEIVNRLAERTPEGPIFRNTFNAPWTKNAMSCQFKTLKKHLGKKYCG